ncbi:MAG: hypothetical protein ACOYI8_02565 [Christensenellales bacterium]|jgi:hypothetical protein
MDMDRVQLVEKLRDKADVSYEEATATLEKTNWDLLKALIYLENKGVTLGITKREKREEQRENAKRTASRVGRAVAVLFDRINRYHVLIKRDDEVLLSIPLLAFLLLLVFMFWWVLPALIIGLFFRFSYAVKGPEKEIEGVTRVMNRASEFAENLREKAESTTDNKED